MKCFACWLILLSFLSSPLISIAQQQRPDDQDQNTSRSLDSKKGTADPNHEPDARIRQLQDSVKSLSQELLETKRQLKLTEQALSASSKSDPFYIEPPEMEAYRDTIRILKDGIYGYEELMREQQAFVDTLLNHLSESSVKDLKKKSRNARLGRYATLEDSLSHYKKITAQQLDKLAAQEAEIELLKTNSSAPEPSTPEPLTSPLVDELKKVKRNLSQSVEENRLLQARLVEEEKKYNALKANEEIAAKQKEGNLKGLEEQYKSQIMALNRQVLNQAKRTRQLEAELQVRLSLQADLQTKLMTKQQEMSKRLARSHSQVKDARGTNRRLRSNIRILEDQLRESESQAAYTRKQAQRINAELEKTRSQLMEKSERLEHLQYDLEEARLERQQAEVARNRFKNEAEASRRLIDSMIVYNQSIQWRSQRLHNTIDSLHGEIALLDPYSESARARRRVYQQQLDNLTRLQKQLPELEKSLYARDKLLDQRERYLREFGNNGTFGSLLDQLEEATREKEAYKRKLEETSPDFSLARSEIYTSDTQRDNRVVTAFCLDSKQAGLVLRAKILDYFRDKKIAKLSDEPLTFAAFSNASISDLPFTLAFDISEEVSTGWRRVACTVRLSNGLYLAPAANPGSRKAVERLLGEILGE